MRAVHFEFTKCIIAVAKWYTLFLTQHQNNFHFQAGIVQLLRVVLIVNHFVTTSIQFGSLQ